MADRGRRAQLVGSELCNDREIRRAQARHLARLASIKVRGRPRLARRDVCLALGVRTCTRVVHARAPCAPLHPRRAEGTHLRPCSLEQQLRSFAHMGRRVVPPAVPCRQASSQRPCSCEWHAVGLSGRRWCEKRGARRSTLGRTTRMSDSDGSSSRCNRRAGGQRRQQRAKVCTSIAKRLTAKCARPCRTSAKKICTDRAFTMLLYAPAVD